MTKEASEGELVRGKYKLGEIARITIFLNVLLSLFRLNFTHGVVKGNCQGKFSPELNYLENNSLGRGIYPCRWG